MQYARLANPERRRPRTSLRRWIRNHAYWWKSDLTSIPWDLETLFGTKKVYWIQHRYQYGGRPDFVIGRGDPGNILAYLHFLAERRVEEDFVLDSDAAASLLRQFYGYKRVPFLRKDSAEVVDLYFLRERRCGHRVHNLIGRLLYHRKGIVKALSQFSREAIEENCADAAI